MDKLVERESASRSPLVAAPALAVQFFLIPLAVVAVTVGGVSRVPFAAGRRPHRCRIISPRSRTAARTAGWPAAYELSRLMADPKVRADRTLAPALVKAFEQSKDDDPRVRRYLALAIGRLDPPLPEEAVARTLDARSTTPTAKRGSRAIWALGSSGDASVVPTTRPARTSRRTPGIRKMVVYALGALPGDTQLPTLRTALRDESPTCAGMPPSRSRARATAKASRCCSRCSIARYVEQAVKRDVRQDEDQDPIADVMISGLRAAAALKDASLKPSVIDAEPEGSQHEGPAGGARSAEGDRVEVRI